MYDNRNNKVITQFGAKFGSEGRKNLFPRKKTECSNLYVIRLVCGDFNFSHAKMLIKREKKDLAFFRNK